MTLLVKVKMARLPKNSGSTGANAAMTFCDALRDATLAAASLVSAIMVWLYTVA
jgi:hypothetical protein